MLSLYRNGEELAYWIMDRGFVIYDANYMVSLDKLGNKLAQEYGGRHSNVPKEAIITALSLWTSSKPAPTWVIK